ncbi:uncharacterized protein KY384_001559 [Bacidia gigantensis]|uniref:uncharacterized protein n=1 Tax=Bacidia gigantensis TaxID=2732470 RepID=UPI001D052EA1|nr:uncharacterized protein KY384_001559 [Bacidia gigantensis]KAG8533818.1 hypothetical protein KY384_001559 [Bacidia gigantensis]
MAPNKKPDDKITIHDFLETRNTVVAGLSTLQSAISDLSRSYLAHTDNLIGRGGSGAAAYIPNPIGGDNGIFGAPGPTPAPIIETAQEPKKRKRAPHDKNAPKRALTPFFLFLQTARPMIADEMGSGHTAKEVQDEGGKRWREMPENEKEVMLSCSRVTWSLTSMLKKWNEQYGINFARYKELMKAYKAGLPLPEIDEAEAKRLYLQNKQTGKIPDTTNIETQHAPVAEENTETSEDSSSDEESEPLKEPSPPPATKKQKVGKEAAKRKAAAPEPEPVLDPALRGPEKKKPGKRGSKATEAAESKKAAAELAAPPPKTEEKSKKKKQRKSTATDS